MLRRLTLPFLIVLAGCGAEAAPVASASQAATAPVFRGGSAQLRCGSESLRARIRQGQLLVERSGGERSVLAPVADPRAGAGPAYGDGKLTLYKLPEDSRWRLARGGEAEGTPCSAEGAAR